MRILEFLLSFALLVAAFWAYAAAFTPEFAGYELVTFGAGVILTALAFGLPVRRFLKA
ncbi:hypothetical protein [Aurantimicrobium minutum]|uniref:hypothetical protein n=1 Tax=Aurantimicrobium minutum TaxID=708131 RepID=UPI002474DA95|nr:hypothetical protein [Aurantimicrobium minutum]MDH6422836.1 heme/copper-type cytochrome/quinol oxidase subunit 4 [Aurantimicrobium minutum]